MRFYGTPEQFAEKQLRFERARFQPSRESRKAKAALAAEIVWYDDFGGSTVAVIGDHSTYSDTFRLSSNHMSSARRHL
jgi:hypothetical protein